MTVSPGLRERKNARTREAIERAALELALEQGYDATTVDEIAARAEVAPRTVYVRYATKDAIVFGDPEASSSRFEGFLSGFEAFVDDAEGDLLDRLLAYIRATTERAAAGPELDRLRRRAVLEDPYLRRMMRGYYERLEQAIATRLANEIRVPADDSGPRVFAAAVVGLLIEVAQRAAVNPDGSDAFAASAGALSFLRAGLEGLRTAST